MLTSRPSRALLAHTFRRSVGGTRAFAHGAVLRDSLSSIKFREKEDASDDAGVAKPEHAVISTFDLFSIGGTCVFFLLNGSTLMDIG